MARYWSLPPVARVVREVAEGPYRTDDVKLAESDFQAMFMPFDTPVAESKPPRAMWTCETAAEAPAMREAAARLRIRPILVRFGRLPGRSARRFGECFFGQGKSVGNLSRLRLVAFTSYQ